MYTDSDGYLPEWLKDVGRFLGGVLITVVAAALTIASAPALLVPELSSAPLSSLNMTFYGTMLAASPFSSTIKSDMNLIAWNPFNGDANAVAGSKDISFYKGVFVFRYGSSGGGGISFGIIGLGRGTHTDITLLHEYGHYRQQQLLGMGIYTGLIAIPSFISATFTPLIHSTRWYEKWATDWGKSKGFWW
ncbi:MAG: hypothetical protein PHT27_06045 [Candidatus Izemoplasmatales bacterium]|nr:hypothetical protein [Candidatus Izemoplasmatales bacterium]